MKIKELLVLEAVLSFLIKRKACTVHQMTPNKKIVMLNLPRLAKACFAFRLLVSRSLEMGCKIRCLMCTATLVTQILILFSSLLQRFGGSKEVQHPLLDHNLFFFHQLLCTFPFSFGQTRYKYIVRLLVPR